MRFRKFLLGLFLSLGLSGFGTVAHAAPVDVILSLVIDVSGSVDSSEYRLQMKGYADAFRNNQVQANILGGTVGAVAVNVVFFEADYRVTALESFQVLSSSSDINNFASILEGFPRPGYSGGTAIHRGTNRAMDLMLAAVGKGGAFEGTAKRLIDVSGDGEGRSPMSDESAIRRAEMNGIVINGLAIEGQEVTDYYQRNVITKDGFVLAADSFNDFSMAILEKIKRETAPVPEPGSLALFGISLFALGFLRRRSVVNDAGVC